MRFIRAWPAAVLAGAAVACSQPEPAGLDVPSPRSAGQSPAVQTPLARAEPEATTEPQPGAAGTGAAAPPAWLGTRVLPRTATGYGEVRPTPRSLRDRRLTTTDLLPPPPDGRFSATVGRVPPDVVRRSTWDERCPVDLADLRYLTVSFWGFDNRPHTGELIVHAGSARDVSRVFRRLYRERFPIEEMRVVASPELDLPPTGDGNNTTAFVCRPARGSTSWSQHAYGLAVDVNPFHNPYVKGAVVLPELASAYTERSWRRPGMHTADGPAVRAFAAIGWEWGGTWSGLKDWMHFSANGR